jgi:hypothetical protein
MATFSNTSRPGYVWDATDNVWYPIGVGAHTHTAAAVGAIANTLTTTTGDIIYASAANTPARLGIGSTGQVLSVSSGVPAWTGAPAFSAYRATSAQSFTASTFVKVQLNAEFFDTDNCFDSATNYRFTPTVAGKYQINLSAIMGSTAPGRTIWTIYKNGSSYVRLYDDIPTNAASQSSGAVMIDMNGSTDYLELYAYCAGTGPNSDYYSGGTGTIFSGHWVRA